MSNVPSPGSVEADLLRRLQGQNTTPLEGRLASVETAVGDHEFRLGGHDSRLDGHDNTLAAYGGRISAAESLLGSHGSRITAAENTILGHGISLLDHAARLTSLEALPFRVVTTEAELVAALLVDRNIFILGTINLSAGIVASRPYAKLWGTPGGSKLVLPHVTGLAQSVITINSHHIHIRGLEITTNHPLVTDNAYNPSDAGIFIPNTVGLDWSGLVVEDCWIHHVSFGIRRWPGSASQAFAKGVVIRNNQIESFCRYGIELNWRMKHLLVAYNQIIGRVGAEAHTNENGIWVGNACDYAKVLFNHVAECDRHPIEVWNSAAGGNIDPIIHGNTLGINGRYGTYSFGITAIGTGTITISNNVIEEAVGIGIEMANDPVNNGSYKCFGNAIRRVVGKIAGLPPLGMSIDARADPGNFEGEVTDNFIGEVVHTNGTTEAFGVQALYGCASLLFAGNRFKNSGNRQFYTNGFGGHKYNGLVLFNNMHHWTAAAPFRGYNASVSLQDTQATVELRNNRVRRPIGATYGSYHASNTSAVLTGGAAYAALTTAGPVIDVQGESNLFMDY